MKVIRTEYTYLLLATAPEPGEEGAAQRSIWVTAVSSVAPEMGHQCLGLGTVRCMDVSASGPGGQGVR